MSHTHPTIIFKIQLEVTSLISTDVGEEENEELPREVCPVKSIYRESQVHVGTGSPDFRAEAENHSHS